MIEELRLLAADDLAKRASFGSQVGEYLSKPWGPAAAGGLLGSVWAIPEVSERIREGRKERALRTLILSMGLGAGAGHLIGKAVTNNAQVVEKIKDLV